MIQIKVEKFYIERKIERENKSRCYWRLNYRFEFFLGIQNYFREKEEKRIIEKVYLFL